MLTKALNIVSTVRVVQDSNNVFHVGVKYIESLQRNRGLCPPFIEDGPRMVAHACICGDNLSRV